MHQRTLQQVRRAVFALVIAVGCTDQTEPVGPATTPDHQRVSLDALPADLDSIATFTFRRPNGRPIDRDTVVSTQGFVPPFVVQFSTPHPDIANASTLWLGSSPVALADSGGRARFVLTAASIAEIMIKTRLQGRVNGELTVEILGQKRICPDTAGRPNWLQQLVDAAAPGDTISICAGVFRFGTTQVRQPIVIRGTRGSGGAHATTLTGGSIQILGPSLGTVTIEDLQFEEAFSGRAVTASSANEPQPGDVRVRRNRFLAPLGSTLIAVTVSGTQATQARVTIEDNYFYGGAVHVLGGNPSSFIETRGNTFVRASLVAAQYQSGARGSITDNVVEGCGQFSQSCLAAIGTPYAEISRNRVSEVSAGVAQNAIVATALAASPSPVQLVVRDNTIDAPAPAIASDSTTYGFRVSGILLNFGSQAQVAVSGNEVKNAWRGIRVTSNAQDARLLITDNSIDGAREATSLLLNYSSPLPPTEFTFTRNDVTNSFIGARLDGNRAANISLRCNWWGQPSLPVTINATASQLEPVALEPIAGRPSVVCSN